MFLSCHLGRRMGQTDETEGTGGRAAWDKVTRVQRAGDEDGGTRSGLERALDLHIHAGKDKKC